MIIAVSIAALILLIVVSFIALDRREHTRITVAQAAILSMPIEVARAKAISLIQAGSFRTVRASDDLDVDALPTGVGELLLQYQEMYKHEFWLGRSGLAEAARVPGCLKIGGDSDFEEVLVKPGDERIFLSHPEDFIGQNPEILPSIWHKILLVAAEQAAT